MSAADQHLRNQILIILRRDGGRTMEELATLTGVPLPKVKQAVFALVATYAVALCEGYATLAGPRPDARRPA